MRIRWVADDTWWTVFTPLDAKFDDRAFECLNYGRSNMPVESCLPNNNSDCLSYCLQPALVRKWDALQCMLESLLAALLKQTPLPVDTVYPMLPNHYGYAKEDFWDRKSAVKAAITSRCAFVVYMAFMAGVAAYSQPQLVQSDSQNSLWCTMRDDLRSLFERTWIFRPWSLARAGGFVDVSKRSQWWSMLPRILDGADIPLWLYFGVEIPKCPQGDCLEAFWSTQVKVNEISRQLPTSSGWGTMPPPPTGWDPQDASLRQACQECYRVKVANVVDPRAPEPCP